MVNEYARSFVAAGNHAFVDASGRQKGLVLARKGSEAAGNVEGLTRRSHVLPTGLVQGRVSHDAGTDTPLHTGRSSIVWAVSH